MLLIAKTCLQWIVSAEKGLYDNALIEFCPLFYCWRVIECWFLLTMACFSWEGKSFQEPGKNPYNTTSENPSEKLSVNPNENPSVKESKNTSKNLQRTQTIASVTTKNPTTTTENPTTCSMQCHQLQVQKLKMPPPEQQFPQLVQFMSNSHNCKYHHYKSLHVPHLSFFMFHNYHSSSINQRFGR